MSNSTGAAPQRAHYLDLLKSLLIYGMITTHVTQLLTFQPKAELNGDDGYPRAKSAVSEPAFQHPNSPTLQ